jgi:hypothetical protein
MNKLFHQIELIEQIDQLIRLQATGTPQTFAERLKISSSSLYRLIEIIREMGAPIEYSIASQSYIYKIEVDFVCGFFIKELTPTERKKVNAGFQISSFFSKKYNFFHHSQNLRVGCANLADVTLHKC